jgi:hypothetical protein
VIVVVAAVVVLILAWLIIRGEVRRIRRGS